MNGYLLSVVGTVLLCGILTAIAPEGKTATTVKGIARLVCVLAIVAPVLQFFKSGSLKDLFGQKGDDFFSETVIEKDDEIIQYYSETRVKETEKALAKELESLYGISVGVRFEWRMEAETFASLYSVQNLSIERIRIKMQEETPKEVGIKMAGYVKEKYRSEVLIE